MDRDENMASIWHHVRTGSWLTAERIRAYSAIMLALAVAAMIGWIALSTNTVDLNGKPIGTDFSSFYAAGSLALEGRAADAYDMAAHHARQAQVFGPNTPYYAWLYPPIFLLIATPLALLPYALALALWQGLTLALYAGVIGAIVRQSDLKLRTRDWIVPAIAFPAVLINLGHGQNGLLTAALFGAALLTLPTRPIAAGVLFGMLAYKPQFALMIPLALLAARQWKAIAAAAVTLIALMALTALIFGLEPWHAFLASTTTARVVLLEHGAVGFEKLQSVFAALRARGASVPVSYAVQSATTIAVGVCVVWIWSGPHRDALKAAALAIAALLASPHVLDYDLMLLGPALAFVVLHAMTDGPRGYEISVFALAWIAPLVARTLGGVTGIPIGLITLLLLFAFTLRRAAADSDPRFILRRSVAQA